MFCPALRPAPGRATVPGQHLGAVKATRPPCAVLEGVDVRRSVFVAVRRVRVGVGGNAYAENQVPMTTSGVVACLLTCSASARMVV